MFFSKKTIAAALTFSMLSTVMPGAVPQARADDGQSTVVIVLLLLTTVFVVIGEKNMSAQAVESLLDQAYAGNGEKLETLAGASGQSVEFVADTIIRLEKDGRISTNDPKAMAETLAAELSK